MCCEAPLRLCVKQFGNNVVFKRILFRPEPMMIPAGTGTFSKSGGPEFRYIPNILQQNIC